jgi:hypothetical protein
MSDPAAASVDPSSAVDATSIGNTAAIHATAIDAATIITARAWRIGRISTSSSVVSAGGAVIHPATNHTTAIDRAAAVNPATPVNTASPINRSTSVNATPSSNGRHQGVCARGIANEQMRLHHCRQSLRWLRNKQGSCCSDYERTESQKIGHLQLLAHQRPPIGVAMTPASTVHCRFRRHSSAAFLDLDQCARPAKPRLR